MRQIWLLGIVFIAFLPTAAWSQDWNTDVALDLVRRAIERRVEARADSGLRDFSTRAHGFVFFLGQLGDLSEPPRLVKSDQLELEVYWKAPDRIKQVIIGWRDRADLPTDIQYHRDHMGIVTNNFGDRIGIGEGDEISDVPHPLSPDGPGLYDFALVDSLSVRLPDQSVRVYEVNARPKDFEAARVIGTLYIDVERAELVRFRFNFTRNAYIDDTLDDITVVLENGLWDGRYWLPRRQELEIRRHTSWLDLPARGIIRGWWEIDGYEFNTGLPDALFRGPEIVAAAEAVRDTFQWAEPLDAAVREIAGPGMTFDLEGVRAEVMELAQNQVLTGFSRAKPGARSVSDLLHFNRVEGLAPGFGGIFRPGSGALELRLWGSYGIDDQRLKGRVTLERSFGNVTVQLQGGRTVRDIGDEPIISPILNSLTAQEFGNDFGDYFLATEGIVSAKYEFGPRLALSASVGATDTESMAVVAQPATGTFRPNSALGAGRLMFVTLALERRSAGFSYGHGVSGKVSVESGMLEDEQYLRVSAGGRAQFPVGAVNVVTRAWVGWGTEGLPAHRGFVVGGRGTLVGESFRVWGGRRVAFAAVEGRIPAPFFAIPMGARVSTGDRIFVIPFVAAGWTGGGIANGVGLLSGGIRPVVGTAFEWFHSLLRVDFAMSLRDERFGVVFDVSRDLWPIL
jgi:hypothetical protein